jgi:Outer membrane protein beta-barrel domain
MQAITSHTPHSNLKSNMRFVLINPAKVALTLGALCLLAAAPAMAQLKFGLKVAPTVAYSRITDETSRDLSTGDIKYSGNGPGIGFTSGLVLDYFIKPNYAVSSGLFYTVKKARVDGGNLGTINWNLQMLQIPVTMKLFTNEIATDMKLYFQLGGSLDFIVTQKKKKFSPKDPAIVDFDGAPFKSFDVSILAGAGLEYRLAESTTLFGGFSYNRGLLNLVTKFGAFNENKAVGYSSMSNANDRYGVRVDMISLDAGIKF